MDARGYSSTVHHPRNISLVKAELGLKPEWTSCHTAVTHEGFIFEGHIPEKFIAQFLAAPPEGAMGLAVPGMPIGGPGMEMGNRFTPYDILPANKNDAIPFSRVSKALLNNTDKCPTGHVFNLAPASGFFRDQTPEAGQPVAQISLRRAA